MIKQSFFVGLVGILFVCSVCGIFAQENETINVTFFEEFNESSNETFTEQLNETIIEQVETNTTETNETTALICSAEQCDIGCAVCSDSSCYMPEVGCVEELSIDKITPATLSKGEQQLNILIKNTGNVAMPLIEVDVVGNGITTVEKMPIEVLVAGDKDYTFTKVNVTNTGTIDVIIKLYVNQTLHSQQISQITVVQGIVEEQVQETSFNLTEAAEKLEAAKTTYNELEKEYYEKEKEGYVLYSVKEDFDAVKESLRLAQVAIIEENSKDFEKNLVYATTSLETVQEQLASAQKEQKTVWQILYENLAVIGTLLGVLISVITVWSMTKVHLKKARIVNIIKGKQILNVGKKEDVENIVDNKSDSKK